MIPIYVGCKYFPHKKGLVTGIILTAFGLSTLVLSTYIEGFINPDDIEPEIEENGYKYFDEEVAEGFPMTF